VVIVPYPSSKLVFCVMMKLYQGRALLFSMAISRAESGSLANYFVRGPALVLTVAELK